MKNVFIIGSKGIPANYGGFETFVEKLTELRKSENIKYHVACMKKNGDNRNEFEHNNARCFQINVPPIGPAKAVFYDIQSLRKCIRYIKENSIKKPIIYILACRIGPFMNHYKKDIMKLGGKVYVNPDGHEWKRDKWNSTIKKYWKISESLMVKNTDLLICDSRNIEKYIQQDYAKYNPRTTYISYGSDDSRSTLLKNDTVVIDWFDQKKVTPRKYFLVVGRFVPENNYKIIIREYMRSNTKKDLVLITNVERNSFYQGLKKETHFDLDPRIKFVGTVYNQELLKFIRENAAAYIHGHEVGGTNPSLLEAMAYTDINLLLDVAFNKEVGKDAAIYWNKSNLSKIIDNLDRLPEIEIKRRGNESKKIVHDNYSWNDIVNKYERLWERSF